MIDFKALNLIQYGMFVVASSRPSTPLGVKGRLNGQIANTVFQVAAEPPLVAISLNCRNFTHELVSESRRFSVTILSEDAPLKFIGVFGFKCGRDVEKFSGISHRVLASGTPVILDYGLAYLDVEVTQSVALGTHTLFIGQVVESGVLAEGRPMTYDHYHQIKGGLTQKNAPTYHA
jgi:ferric-chelate reductase [NAD(P)H]